jgi:hypothetical protein
MFAACLQFVPKLAQLASQAPGLLWYQFAPDLFRTLILKLHENKAFAPERIRRSLAVPLNDGRILRVVIRRAQPGPVVSTRAFRVGG